MPKRWAKKLCRVRWLAACWSAASSRTGSKITVRTGVAHERIRLVVLDNGPDVPAVRLGNMFEPFVSTKSEGLGLGLSMCATIAESHGGSTALANNRDVGASAILTLPVAKME